jgi:predicted amino acid dehydrogenase
MSAVLSGSEVCLYFESLSEGRRALVWVRCERALGRAVEDCDFNDEELDEAWEAVLTDMWCNDQLRRLVDFGRLECQTASDGQLLYITPAA